MKKLFLFIGLGLFLLIGLGLFLAPSLQSANNDLDQDQDEIESLLSNQNVWYGTYYGNRQYGWIESKFIIHSSNKYSNNKVYEIYTKDYTATKYNDNLEITETEESYFFDSRPPYNILGYEKKNTENENLAKINGKRVKNDFELEYIENNNVRKDKILNFNYNLMDSHGFLFWFNNNTMEIGKISPAYKFFDFSQNDYYMASSEIVEINVNDANEIEYLTKDKFTLSNNQVVEASRILNNKGIDKFATIGGMQIKLQKKEEAIKFDPIDLFLLTGISIDKDILEKKTLTKCAERESKGFAFEDEEYQLFNYTLQNYSIENISNDRCSGFELDQQVYSDLHDPSFHENACYIVKPINTNYTYYPTICREVYQIKDEDPLFPKVKVMCKNYDHTLDINFEPNGVFTHTDNHPLLRSTDGINISHGQCSSEQTSVQKIVFETEDEYSGGLYSGGGQILENLSHGKKRITLDAGSYQLEKATKEDVAIYLKDSPTYPFKDPKIQQLIKEIKSQKFYDENNIERSLLNFVHNFIQYDETSNSTSVFDILESKKGDCTEYQLLFMTLARGMGIPTRAVSGWSYMGDKKYGGHAWNETIFEKNGEFFWLPLDPTNYSVLPLHIKGKELETTQPDFKLKVKEVHYDNGKIVSYK